MEKIRRTYDLPDKLVDAFEEWRGKTRVQATQSIAAAIVHIMTLSGDQRDELFSRLDAWLGNARQREAEEMVLREVKRERDAAGLDGSAASNTAGRKAKAIRQTIDQERGKGKGGGRGRKGKAG